MLAMVRITNGRESVIRKDDDIEFFICHYVTCSMTWSTIIENYFLIEKLKFFRCDIKQKSFATFCFWRIEK